MKKNKDYTLVLLFIILIISILASSCTSASGRINDDKVEARVNEAYYNSNSGEYEVIDKEVLIKYVNKANKAGDVIKLGYNMYIIESIINTPLEELPSGMNLVHKAPRYSDYELNIISEDSIAVFDGRRYVGTIFFTDDSELGALLYKDNE